MAGLLSLLATVAYGRHVADGGFYLDVWGNAAARVFCARLGVAITYPRYDSNARSGYEETFFLDVPSGAISRIASRTECLRAIRQFHAGSDYSSAGAG